MLGNLDRYMQKIKLDHQLTPHTRINSKWIKDLNVSNKTIKILEENIGSKISDISCSNFLASVSPRALETKEKISKWDCIKSVSYTHLTLPTTGSLCRSRWSPYH